MGDKQDEIQDWLGRIDPMGSLGRRRPRKLKHVLPLARLAVIQTIALALILALTVVGIMALVTQGQPGKPSSNSATKPQAQIVPPPQGGVPAFTIGSDAVPGPDARAGELPEKLVAWRIDSGAEKAFGPVAFNNHQFAFAGDNGNIFGVRVDGAKQWSYRFPDSQLRGLISAAGGVLAYGRSKAVVLNQKGEVRHTLNFKTATRGRVNYDPASKQLVTYSYRIAGQRGERTEESTVSVYSVTDGSLVWEWQAPDTIYWAVFGGDAVYTLVRTGERDLYGSAFPTTEVYKVTPSGVSWHKDFGVHYGDSEPLLLRDTLYVGGTTGKKPALLAVDPATGNVQRSTKLDRWATSPLRGDPMRGTIYVPGSNVVQAVMADQLLYKAGNDVDHAQAFAVHGGYMVLLRTYDLMIYDGTGRAGAKIPLGKELGNLPKGSILHHQNGILATIGGELISFDLMSNSGESAQYVR